MSPIEYRFQVSISPASAQSQVSEALLNSSQNIAPVLCWAWFNGDSMMPKKLNMLAYAGSLCVASFACMLGLLVGKHTITFCWCCGALSASVKCA